MSELTIHHELGEIVVRADSQKRAVKLKRTIREALDRCQEDEPVPAKLVHGEARERHGDYYRTPGYFLRLYRQRAGMTQVQLAERAGVRQHHLSEMERNKRSVGKAMAKRLAVILDCDYRRLL